MGKFRYDFRVGTATASGITRFVNSLKDLTPNDRRIAFDDLARALGAENSKLLLGILLGRR